MALVKAAGALVAIATLFAAACQIWLPTLAAGRLRDSLAAHGEGVHVTVHAFPAVELLFGHADRVTVSARRLLPSGHGSLTNLLERVGHAGQLDARVNSMVADGLALENVSLHKRGTRVTGSATVTMHAIEAALPSVLQLSPPSEGVGGPVFRLSAHALGRSLSVSARVVVSGGKLLIEPTSSLLSFVHVTVFADPHVRMESVSVSRVGSAFTFQARGSYQ